MKYYVAILVIAAVLLAGCLESNVSGEGNGSGQGNGSGTAANNTANFTYLNYTNAAFGIAIKYPSTWTKNEQFTGAVVAFTSPSESSSGASGGIVSVVVEELPEPMTLSEYNDAAIAALNQTIVDFNLSETTAATLDNNPAHKIVYTTKQNQINLRAMQVWTLKDNKTYILTYGATPINYDKYQTIVQEMFSSFEIVG
jgi:serine/threonine-protein kinase